MLSPVHSPAGTGQPNCGLLQPRCGGRRASGSTPDSPINIIYVCIRCLLSPILHFQILRTLPLQEVDIKVIDLEILHLNRETQVVFITLNYAIKSFLKPCAGFRREFKEGRVVQLFESKWLWGFYASRHRYGEPSTLGDSQYYSLFFFQIYVKRGFDFNRNV